jgi:hypothetical protein
MNSFINFNTWWDPHVIERTVLIHMCITNFQYKNSSNRVFTQSMYGAGSSRNDAFKKGTTSKDAAAVAREDLGRESPLGTYSPPPKHGEVHHMAATPHTRDMAR